MMKVSAVRKNENGSWSWKINGVEYKTNRKGCGVFTEDEHGFCTKQIVGTCDFSACKTVSGTRRKIKNWFSYIDLFE